MVTDILKHDNVNTQLSKVRRKDLVTEYNSEYRSKTVFSENVLHLANNSSFLRIRHTPDSGKIFLVFAVDDCELSHTNGNSFSDVITSFFSGYMFGFGTTAHRHPRTVIRVP